MCPPDVPHNMVNFGPLAAESCLPVWGTPANFNGFSRLGSVTARHSSSGRQPNFAALNRGRHLCSAGRPSRWALAHILVRIFFRRVFCVVPTAVPDSRTARDAIRCVSVHASLRINRSSITLAHSPVGFDRKLSN